MTSACASCAAPLAADQRYCLECGARRDGPRTDALALLRAAAAAGAASAAEPQKAAADGAALARRRRAALPVALATFVALLVVVGSRAPNTLAGDIVPAGLTVLLPPAPAPAPPSDIAAADTPSSDVGTSGGADAGTTSDSGAGTNTTDNSGTSDTTTNAKPPDDGGGSGTPPIHHVFLVVLADSDVAALAGDTAAAPYLAGTLVPKGTLLTGYESVARGALANGVALISGQGPTSQTLADCPTYADVAPDKLGADGQQLGDGCVYPFEAGTIADELHGNDKTWRAYVEDVAAAAGTGAAASCRHPALGAADDARDARPGDAYATRRNPFVYFHSLIDEGGACASDDVGLDRLDADLARGTKAPTFSYIVPNLCHDGRTTPCAPGAAAGPAAADTFLKTVVPRILASPAYADNGLLAITSDEPPPPAAPRPSPPPATTPTTTPTPTTPTTPAPPTTTPATTPQTTPTPPKPCCTPTSYPNVGDAVAAGAGGRVGALLISRFVQAGATDATPANHFTLLRTIEDLFQLQPLGYAGSSFVTPLPDGIVAAKPLAKSARRTP